MGICQHWTEPRSARESADLRESPVVVARRAKKLQTILLGLGVPASALSVDSRLEPDAADGVGQ